MGQGKATWAIEVTPYCCSSVWLQICPKVGVVDTLYEAAGSGAIFNINPFERRFRDIHSVAQQLQGRQQHFETVGQYMMGLEPDVGWL
jgi:hypothetical protein